VSIQNQFLRRRSFGQKLRAAGTSGNVSVLGPLKRGSDSSALSCLGVYSERVGKWPQDVAVAKALPERYPD
jgi:hypothetical protein